MNLDDDRQSSLPSLRAARDATHSLLRLLLVEGDELLDHGVALNVAGG